MFDFSSLFTPDRMAQGAQGVQSINQMPWMFNNYLPQMLNLMNGGAPAATQAQTPAAAPLPSPLMDMLGLNGNPSGPENATWANILQNTGGDA